MVTLLTPLPPQPGYLRSLLPAEAPTQPDSWEDILADYERVVMPGEWTSPPRKTHPRGRVGQRQGRTGRCGVGMTTP